MTDYGTMETTADGRYVLRYERRLRHPIEKVWAALTEPDRMEEWWARAAVLELAEGGRARIEWLNSDAVAEGRITRLEPPHTIEFDTDIHGSLLWELQPARRRDPAHADRDQRDPRRVPHVGHGAAGTCTSTSSRTRSTAARSTGRTGRRTAGRCSTSIYEANMRPIS